MVERQMSLRMKSDVGLSGSGEADLSPTSSPVPLFSLLWAYSMLPITCRHTVPSDGRKQIAPTSLRNW